MVGSILSSGPVPENTSGGEQQLDPSATKVNLAYNCLSGALVKVMFLGTSLKNNNKKLSVKLCEFGIVLKLIL